MFRSVQKASRFLMLVLAALSMFFAGRDAATEQPLCSEKISATTVQEGCVSDADCPDGYECAFGECIEIEL